MIIYYIIFAVLIVLEILYWLYPEVTDRIRIPAPISYAISIIFALIGFAAAVFMFYMGGENPENANACFVIGVVILFVTVISFIHAVKEIKNAPQRQLTNAIYWNDIDRTRKLVREEMKREEELQGNTHTLGRIGATLFFLSLFLIIILLLLVYLA